MTHILFITPYYPPEKAVPAIRISETAAQLVQRGYEVTVLTTIPNHPTGIVPPEYRERKMIRREVSDGVRIIRVWSFISPNKGFFRRTLSQLSFGSLAAILGGKAVGHPDIIIVQSPPLFDAISGRLLAWLKHCPFIFLVADIWPESAVQLGLLRNRLLINLSKRLEWSTYLCASAVWVVTEAVRQRLIQQGLPAEHIFLITNGVDTAKFRPMPQDQARAALGWDSRFTVLYAGTHGLAHGLITVLEAAERLQDFQDIRFVLAGDGADKANLMAYAQHHNLQNVTFLDSQPHDRMPLLLAGADVCLVPLRKLPLFKTTLPAKMCEIMACARPIILGADGEARRLVEQEAKAALYVEPEDPSALASAIITLYENPSLARSLGERGPSFVRERFDRGQLTTQLEDQVVRLLQKQSHIVPKAFIPASMRSLAEKPQVYSHLEDSF